VGIAALLCAERVIAQVSAEGMRVLARERSLAEQFLALLNEFGRKDVTQYARGVMLYAAAKAEFDGLIAEVEHQPGQKLPPDQSPTFQTALNGAVEKRVAFTNFISDTVLPQGRGNKKGHLRLHQGAARVGHGADRRGDFDLAGVSFGRSTTAEGDTAGVGSTPMAGVQIVNHFVYETHRVR
jgi:hypothetical protein